MKIGLTYSCPVACEQHPIVERKEIYDFVNEKVGGIKEYYICRELHENGKFHFHAYFHFRDNFETTNVRYFDFKDVHPDILRPKKDGKFWVRYMEKTDDDPYTNIQRCVWKSAMKKKNAEAAIDFLWKEQPKMMIMHSHNIEKNIQKRMAPKVSTKHFYGPWWPRLIPIDDLANNSFIFFGEPGTNKTQFALSHFKNPLLVCDIDDLLAFKPGTHDGIVFDDCDFTKMSDQQQIQIVDCDIDRTIRCRYINPRIPAGTFKVFTTNTLDFMNLDHGGISRRVKVFHFPECLISSLEEQLVLEDCVAVAP